MQIKNKNFYISGGDPHRRAQSKSPERRNDYLDNIASDMSKKLREFGDAVRQRISRKPTAQKPAKVRIKN